MGATTLGDIPVPEHSPRAPQHLLRLPGVLPEVMGGLQQPHSQHLPTGKRSPNILSLCGHTSPVVTPQMCMGVWLWKRWGSGKEAGKVERSRRKVAGKWWQSSGLYLVPREVAAWRGSSMVRQGWVGTWVCAQVEGWEDWSHPPASWIPP